MKIYLHNFFYLKSGASTVKHRTNIIQFYPFSDLSKENSVGAQNEIFICLYFSIRLKT